MNVIIFCNDGFIDIHIKITGFRPCSLHMGHFCPFFHFNLPNRLSLYRDTHTLKYSFQIRANISYPSNWPHHQFSQLLLRRELLKPMLKRWHQQLKILHHRPAPTLMMRYLKKRKKKEFFAVIIDKPII